jgi:hypothetical protein
MMKCIISQSLWMLCIAISRCNIGNLANCKPTASGTRKRSELQIHAMESLIFFACAGLFSRLCGAQPNTGVLPQSCIRGAAQTGQKGLPATPFVLDNCPRITEEKQCVLAVRFSLTFASA